MEARNSLEAAERERTEGSRARAQPRRAFRAVRGLTGTPVPRSRVESRAAAVQVRKGGSSRAQTHRERSSGGGAGSVPYRALGTSTGPRPPPPGPDSTSPPYFSSIPGLRSLRCCSSRRVSSCLVAAAERRAQACHSPIAAAA